MAWPFGVYLPCLLYCWEWQGCLLYCRAALGTMAAGAIGAAGADINIPSSVIAGLQARLKAEASQALAGAAQDAGGKVSEERAHRALDQLDRETTTGIVIQLVRGNPESAKAIRLGFESIGGA
jgi:hypothetical protein